jgi:MoaD family protein
MIVEVLYFAEFKQITNKDQEKFELDNNHLNELVKLLIKKYGKKIQNLIWDEKNKQINSLVSIVINNQAIREKDPLQIDLIDGDTIVFLMPVSGG